MNRILFIVIICSSFCANAKNSTNLELAEKRDFPDDNICLSSQDSCKTTKKGGGVDWKTGSEQSKLKEVSGAGSSKLDVKKELSKSKATQAQGEK